MVNMVTMVFYLFKGRLLSPLKRWKDHADHATMHLPQLPDSDIVGSRIGFGSITCSLPTPVDVLEGQSPKIFVLNHRTIYQGNYCQTTTMDRYRGFAANIPT